MVPARVVLFVLGALLISACQPMRVKMTSHEQKTTPSTPASAEASNAPESTSPQGEVALPPGVFHEPVEFTDIYLAKHDAKRLQADGRAPQVCVEVQSSGDFAMHSLAMDSKRNVYVYNPHLYSSEMAKRGELDGEAFVLREGMLVAHLPDGKKTEYIPSSEAEVSRFLNAQLECLKKDPPIDVAKLEVDNYEQALRARNNLFVGLSRFGKTVQETLDAPVGKGSFEVTQYSDLRAHFIHLHLLESLQKTVNQEEPWWEQVWNTAATLGLVVTTAQGTKWLGKKTGQLFPKTTGKVASGVGKLGVNKVIPGRVASAAVKVGTALGVAAYSLNLIGELQLIYYGAKYDLTVSPTASNDTMEGHYTDHYLQVMEDGSGRQYITLEGGLPKLLQQNEASAIELFKTHRQLAPTLIRFESQLVRVAPEQSQIISQ